MEQLDLRPNDVVVARAVGETLLDPNLAQLRALQHVRQQQPQMVVELLREIAGAREAQALAGLEIPLEQEIDGGDPELLFGAEVVRDQLERDAGVVGNTELNQAREVGYERSGAGTITDCLTGWRSA